IEMKMKIPSASPAAARVRFAQPRVAVRLREAEPPLAIRNNRRRRLTVAPLIWAAPTAAAAVLVATSHQHVGQRMARVEIINDPLDLLRARGCALELAELLVTHAIASMDHRNERP